MAYSQTQKKAVAKYNAKAYDEIKIRVPKGQKEYLQQYSKSKGESLNSFVNKAIDQAILTDQVSENNEHH